MFISWNPQACSENGHLRDTGHKLTVPLPLFSSLHFIQKEYTVCGSISHQHFSLLSAGLIPAGRQWRDIRGKQNMLVFQRTGRGFTCGSPQRLKLLFCPYLFPYLTVAITFSHTHYFCPLAPFSLASARMYSLSSPPTPSSFQLLTFSLLISIIHPSSVHSSAFCLPVALPTSYLKS